MTKTKNNIPKYVYGGDNFIIADNNGTEKLLRIINDDDPNSPREWDNVGTMVCWHSRYNLGDKHNYSEPRDFFADLVEDFISDKDIVAYVKAGKVKDLELKYDRATHEWELLEYDDYFKKQYSIRTYESPLDKEYQFIADDIRENMSIGNLKEFLINADVYMLPLYLYDHSGITMSTGSFSCPWDSGQVGYIYVTKEKIFKECMYKNSDGNYEKVADENWRDVAEHYLNEEVETYDDYLTGSVYGYQVYDIDENREVGDKIDSCWGYYGNELERSGILDEFKIVRKVDVEEKKTTTTTIRIVA